MSHVRFHQQVGGVPVMGGDLIVHLDARDDVRSAGGRFAPPTGLDTVPGLTEEQAIPLARLHWPQQLPDGKEPEVLRVELKVYCPGLTLNDGSAEQFLVWDVWLGASCGTGCGNRWEEAFYMDAHSGELRGRMSLVAGLDRRVLDCSARLDDLCYSEYYDEVLHYTFGRREGAPARGPNPRCLPEISTDTDEAYDLLEGVHNYVLDRFGRNGANGQGGTGTGSMNRPVTRTVVQVYRDYTSAPNCPYGASYFWSSSNISLCKDVAVPDILSHEYFHALDAYTAKLTYSGESGALNEANSFILAEVFERSCTGFTDWISAGTLPAEANPVSFVNPPGSILLGTSPIMRCADRFYSPHVYCGSATAGLYNKATIPGKAAYLLSEGDYFNGCTIRAIGVERLEQIWYRALVHYFVSSETFNGAYAKLQQAAADLYPDDAHTRTQVRRAFQAVEMDQPGKCSGIAARIPQALDVQGW